MSSHHSSSSRPGCRPASFPWTGRGCWLDAPGPLCDTGLKSFAAKVVEHCRTCAGATCNLSYLTGIFEDDPERAAMVADLEAGFAIRPSPRYRSAFSTKAMYGTDWHMPTMARRAADYLDCLVGIFDSNEILRPLKDALLGGNGIKFLGGRRRLVTRPGPQVQR